MKYKRMNPEEEKKELLERLIQARKRLEELRSVKKPEKKFELEEKIISEEIYPPKFQENFGRVEKEPEIPKIPEFAIPEKISPPVKPALEPIIRTMPKHLAEIAPKPEIKPVSPLPPAAPPTGGPKPIAKPAPLPPAGGPKISPAKPSKPFVLPKNFFKIVFGVFAGLLFLSAVSLGVFWYFKFQPVPPGLKPFEAPESLIKSEKVVFFDLTDLDKEEILERIRNEISSEAENTFAEIYFKKTFPSQFCRLGKCVSAKQEKIIGAKEFFNILDVAPPETFLDSFSDDFSLFAFYQDNQPRKGLILKSRDLEKTRFGLETWPAIINDLSFLFEGVPIGIETKARPFKDGLYQNIAFRSIDLGGFDAFLNYFLFPAKNAVILNTSSFSNRILIERLLGLESVPTSFPQPVQ